MQGSRVGCFLLQWEVKMPQTPRVPIDDVARPDERYDAIERGSVRVHTLPGDPAEVHSLLEETREVLAHTLGAGVTIAVEAASELPPVLAGRSQLKVALVILGTNARDAMPEGGTLTLSARAETVLESKHPAGLTPGRYVRLAVADTGTGMETATLARPAGPFFTSETVGKGTELGLLMARGFAERSGGRLHIDSAPGQGTTVTLWLPAAEAAAGSATLQKRAMPLCTRSPRILLVDDDALVRDVIAESLADLGYEVMRAEDGPSALGLLDSGEAVDLLVTDLSMPGMDGVAVIREVQRRRPGLPSVLLTGFPSETAVYATIRGLGCPFILLRKPISGPELAERLAAMLVRPIRERDGHKALGPG
jgi:CheY-like chemotaxis protein